jgi:hypothetical protein
MRRMIVCGCLAAVALVTAAPQAKASDDSIRAVVKQQATRQIKEDNRFSKALKHLKTKKGLKKASKAAGRQAASVKLWHDALAAETADTPQVAEGQKDMLSALDLYTKGIRRFQKAVRQALHSGGSSGGAKAAAAGRNMRTAAKRVAKAADKIMG